MSGDRNERSWFHELCTDGVTFLYGFFYDQGKTEVVNLNRREDWFVLEGKSFYNPVYISRDFIAFCDGFTFGVINLSNGSYWEKRGDPQYFGADHRSGSFLIQRNRKLVRYDPGSGKEMSAEPCDQKLEAIGATWSLKRDEEYFVVESSNFSRREFVLRNCLGRTRESNGFIIVNDRQHFIRAIDVISGDVVFEKHADANSEFSEAEVTDDGDFVYTQHYFGKAHCRETLIHTVAIATGSGRCSTLKIETSGMYCLRNNGRTIAFATCEEYNTQSGKKFII